MLNCFDQEWKQQARQLSLQGKLETILWPQGTGWVCPCHQKRLVQAHFHPQETSWAHAGCIPCAPGWVAQVPAPEPHTAAFQVAVSAWPCCGPLVSYSLPELLAGGEWRVKHAQEEEERRREGSFCPSNKPCVPNFTLICSLRQLCPLQIPGLGKAEGWFCSARLR